MKSADAVVVGCGVIGASIAYHLAARGLKVIVLERAATPGAGSTSRATGGYRAQFGSEINVRLSLLSREKLRAFRDETGVDPGYDPRGYLFLATHCDELTALSSAQAIQRRCGFNDAQMISTAEALAINPHVNADGVVGASFCAGDGFIRPMEILRGYFEAASRAGVEFRFDCREPRPLLARNRIESVRAGEETIAAGLFVNAAGAWAAEFAESCGVSLPVTPVKRHVVPTEATDVIAPTLPMTIWVTDGFHFRQRDGRVLLLRPHEATMASRYDTSIEPEWIDETVRLARERVPLLRDVAIDRSAAWSGLYEMSPDRHAIIGPASELENLYLANGSSGHGVMHAPAIGELLADMITGRTASIDLEPLRPSRFAEGQPVIGSSLL